MGLSVRNFQPRPLKARHFRTLTLRLLRQLLEVQDFELGICFLGVEAMTRMNETFLKHAGATDVITFDYIEREPAGPKLTRKQRTSTTTLHGEIFICVEEARAQSRRFKTTLDAELVRYIVHGVLHLQGFDDHTARERRRMKAEENRLVRELSAC